MRFRNNFQKGNNPRRWCNICRYETLPIPVKRYRCSGCGKDYG